MKTILIIEDDVIYARSIGNWLRKQEMGSERVTTLSAARKSLSDREYDLVLADLRLPDGNSTDLLRWMHDRHIATPFLIMTNYGQVESGQLSLQAHPAGQAAGSHPQGVQPSPSRRHGVLPGRERQGA